MKTDIIRVIIGGTNIIILTSTNEHPKHMNEMERNRCFLSELSRMFHSIRRFRGY